MQQERVLTMATKTELNLLLRSQAGLPEGLRLAKTEFCEGWCSVRSRNAERLEKEICAKGWSFDRIVKGLRGCGVGETSQEAIAGALRLALRQMSQQFSAVEVEHIQLTQYPWFFIAKASVSPICIQQGEALSVSNRIAPLSTTVVQVRNIFEDGCSLSGKATILNRLASQCPSTRQECSTSNKRPTMG
jgi:hypothetical protein